MAYIVCEAHGGNVAAMVSPKIAEDVNSNSIKSGSVLQIRSIDKKGNSYRNLVDRDFYNEMQERFQLDLNKSIESEEIMFEIDMELTPICPLCLRDKLPDLF